MIVEGNVGIGTTNPAGLFAVGASSNFMVSSSGIIETINGVTSAGLSSGGLDLVNNSGMVVVRNNANAINSMISLESGTGSGSGIFFKTANSYRGIINGSGYLGIGTTNPIANLEVGTTNPLLVYADNLASNEGLAGVVLSSKGTGSLVLQPSGNVGSVSAKTQLIYYNGANTFSALEYGNVSSGYSSLLLMKSGGNVGIGTTAPGYKLEVYTGSASGWVVTADGTWGSTSDARLKKNIEPMGSALDQVMALNPVTFNMKGESNSDPAHMGFIAQDVEKIVPELVTAGPNGYKGLSYALFTPLLTKAVQEQQLEIRNSQFAISNLDKKLGDESLTVSDKLTLVGSAINEQEAKIGSLQSQFTDYQLQITEAQTRLLEAENNLAAFEASTTDLLASMMETENMITERILSHEERIKALENKMALMTVSPGGEIPSNIVTLDETGSAEIAGIFKAKEVETGKVAADGVVAGSYAVRNEEEDSATLGRATIKAGDKFVIVPTKVANEAAQIFVTPKVPLIQSLAVTETLDDESFKVEIKEPIDEDIIFSWWILSEK